MVSYFSGPDGDLVLENIGATIPRTEPYTGFSRVIATVLENRKTPVLRQAVPPPGAALGNREKQGSQDVEREDNAPPVSYTAELLERIHTRWGARFV